MSVNAAPATPSDQPPQRFPLVTVLIALAGILSFTGIVIIMLFVSSREPLPPVTERSPGQKLVDSRAKGQEQAKVRWLQKPADGKAGVVAGPPDLGEDLLIKDGSKGGPLPPGPTPPAPKAEPKAEAKKGEPKAEAKKGEPK